MKTIEVVAAIIENAEKKEVFATQRGYGEFEGWWEFPGGKMEPVESREEALKREIREELEVEISVDRYVTTVEYDYPKFHLILHCFICSVTSGEIVLLEHKSARWLNVNNIDDVKWLPADHDIIERLKEIYR